MSSPDQPAGAVHGDKPIKLELSIEAVDLKALINALYETADVLTERDQRGIFYPFGSVWVSPSQKGHFKVFNESQPESGGG